MAEPVRLTEQEERVLYLLALGRSHKQIAAELEVEYTTVQNYVDRAKKKAGLTGPVHRLVMWYVTEYRNGRSARFDHRGGRRDDYGRRKHSTDSPRG